MIGKSCWSESGRVAIWWFRIYRIGKHIDGLEEYRAVVLYMTDDAADSLVDSASGLLAVPLAASKVVFAD